MDESTKGRLDKLLKTVGAAFIFCSLLGCCFVQAQTRADGRFSPKHWKALKKRDGWTIRYPPSWQLSSCGQCDDPTAPKVPADLFDPATHELIMIERLADKPVNQGTDEWLDDVSRATVLNQRVGEEWMFVDGMRALKVRNRNPDSGESENIYLVNGSNTFAIRTSKGCVICQQVISTFRLERN